ncbi:NepR family anti-sigma factor [Chthonobacter albigriseus]|uniref:NepR family anti-sigma factor n=1 Tax=Chthonobacter albigriseus TaxID=1683161 RepID=UPI0015EE5EDB|nr:NepR family anti-sigma factor [Chthonobacter albigriseus]
MTRDRTQDEKPVRRTDGVAGKPDARPLSPDLQAHIGVRLKAYYDSVLSEPIPDRFAQLLDKLDSAAVAAPIDGAPKADATKSTLEEGAPAMTGATGDIRR